MASGSELLQALMGSQYTANENPFGIAAQAVGQSAPLLINPYSSGSKNIATSIGAGLLAGLLGGIAKNQTIADNAAFAPLRNEYITATPERQAELLRQNNRLAQLDSVLAANRLERAQKVQEARDLIAPKVEEYDAMTRPTLKRKRGDLILDNLAKVNKTMGDDGQLGDIAPASAFDEVAKREARAAAMKEGAISNAKAASEKNMGLDLKTLSAMERKATDDLTQGPQAARILNINKAGNNILKSVEKQTPLAAQTAIYEFAKLLDPIGTVREGDAMRVADPGGPLGQLAVIYNQIQQKGILTPEAKASMKELVPMLADSEYGAYKLLVDTTLEGVRQQGGRPEKIQFYNPIKFDTPPAVSPTDITEELRRRGALP